MACSCALWALHRHPDLWEDPEAFVPARWMEGTPEAAKVRMTCLVQGVPGSCPARGAGPKLVSRPLSARQLAPCWRLGLLEAD